MILIAISESIPIRILDENIQKSKIMFFTPYKNVSHPGPYNPAVDPGAQKWGSGKKYKSPHQVNAFKIGKHNVSL